MGTNTIKNAPRHILYAQCSCSEFIFANRLSSFFVLSVISPAKGGLFGSLVAVTPSPVALFTNSSMLSLYLWSYFFLESSSASVSYAFKRLFNSSFKNPGGNFLYLLISLKYAASISSLDAALSRPSKYRMTNQAFKKINILIPNNL